MPLTRSGAGDERLLATAPSRPSGGIQRHADPVVPQDLDQRACPPAKDEQIPAVRIALEMLLHQERKALHPLPHVGVAHRQPATPVHPEGSRQRLQRGGRKSRRR